MRSRANRFINCCLHITKHLGFDINCTCQPVIVSSYSCRTIQYVHMHKDIDVAIASYTYTSNTRRKGHMNNVYRYILLLEIFSLNLSLAWHRPASHLILYIFSKPDHEPNMLKILPIIILSSMHTFKNAHYFLFYFHIL